MCRQAEPRWEQAARLAEQARPLVPAGRRDFFQAHVATQIDLHRHSNRMLRYIAEAATPGASNASRQVSIAAAIEEVRAMLDALRQGATGKWDGFHTLGDWFVDIPLTMQTADACLAQLRGQTLTAAQKATLARAERLLRDDTSHVYIKVKAYQQNRKVEFCAADKPPHF